MDRKFINRTYAVLLLIILSLIASFMFFSIFPIISEQLTTDNPDFYVFAPFGIQHKYLETRDDSITWTNHMTIFTIRDRNNEMSSNSEISEIVSQINTIVYNYWAVTILTIFTFIGFVLTLSKTFAKYSKYLLYVGISNIFLSLTLFYLLVKLGLTINNNPSLYQSPLKILGNISLPTSSLTLIYIFLFFNILGTLLYAGLLIDFLFIKKKSLTDEYIGLEKTKKIKETDSDLLDDFPLPNKKPMFQYSAHILNADLDMKFKKKHHVYSNPMDAVNKRTPDDDFLEDFEEKILKEKIKHKEEKPQVQEYDYFESDKDKKDDGIYDDKTDVSDFIDYIEEKINDKKKETPSDVKEAFATPIFKKKIVDLNKNSHPKVKPKKYEEVKPSEKFQDALSSAIDKKRKQREK